MFRFPLACYVLLTCPVYKRRTCSSDRVPVGPLPCQRTMAGYWTGRAAIEGLYAAGELAGGLFYHNYPGGSGLTSGAVFGGRAGAAAAFHRRAAS
jgi:succinate dehydrogenase/fumarate reductase flavoprotein subunit